MMSMKPLVTAIAVLLAGTAHADSFNFRPIDGSAPEDMWTREAPWKLPQGYAQRVVSDESHLNIYDGGRDDWHDMNTANETGRKAGQFLYTTHEVRGAAEGGAVSVVRLTGRQRGETSIITQDPGYDALDGIVWTPWGTVLFAEEKDNGRLFEIVLNDDMVTGTVYERPAVGRLAHEGIGMDAAGNVYVVDEFRGQREGYGGGVYKFVPDTWGDLSSGDLYVLATSEADGTGQGAWVGPINAADARNSGTAFGGHGYNRPEDVQVIGHTLYVNITEGIYIDSDSNGSLDRESFDGRTIAVNLDTLMVTNFVKPGVNVPVETGRPGDANFQTGFDNPDNLAQSPDGRLVIVEDNVPSDIWFAADSNGDGVADSVELFASLSDYGAEGTGIYFSPENPKTLYVNIQHSKEVDGDGTWAISRDPSAAR